MVTGGGDTLRMRHLRGLGLLPLVAAPFVAWGFWWEPASLRVTDVPIAVAGWSGDPLRVALLSDLHVGASWMDVARLRDIVDATNAAQPDLVLLLGDFCINGVLWGEPIPLEVWTPELSRLDAPLGTFAVLGNHDWWNDGDAVAAALEAAGVPVLENEARALDGFWLVGIGDQTTGHDDVDRALVDVPAGALVLGMTHTPDVFDTMDDRVPLLVAGHSHGGQVDLPLIGTPVVPSAYVRGHYAASGRDLFVTSGVGTSILPVRFGVPPEVVILGIEPRRLAASVGR